MINDVFLKAIGKFAFLKNKTTYLTNKIVRTPDRGVNYLFRKATDTIHSVLEPYLKVLIKSVA